MYRISKTRLSAAMLKSGVESSKDLAKLAGISVNTVSRLNNGGSVKLPTIRAIALTLNCDPLEIIEQEE